MRVVRSRSQARPRGCRTDPGGGGPHGRVLRPAAVPRSARAPPPTQPAGVYNVCADVHGGAIAAPQYTGLGRAAATVAGLGIHRLHVLLTRRSSAWSVTNGSTLLAKLRPGTSTALPPVSSSSCATRRSAAPRSTPETDTLRVLFVGYLHPYKGVDQLLQAFADLLGRGVPATLRLVGALPLVARRRPGHQELGQPPARHTCRSSGRHPSAGAVRPLRVQRRARAPQPHRRNAEGPGRGTSVRVRRRRLGRGRGAVIDRGRRRRPPRPAPGSGCDHRDARTPRRRSCTARPSASRRARASALADGQTVRRR